MSTFISIRLSAASVALLALSGCGHLDGLSSTQGQLLGAGTGALAGALASDGVIAPVLGAVGGAILGEELAERDPLVD